MSEKKINSKRIDLSINGPDIEKSKYFVPAVFLVFALFIVFLFREFIFSNKIFHSGDFIQAGMFFRSFFVNYVREYGAIPQWNPYIFGGLPFVDAFHGDLMYPLSALKFIGPLYKTLCYNLIIHIYLAGIFMYFCAREFNLSKTSSLFAGMSYMFSAYLISLIAPFHDGKIFITALFPLLILFLERGFKGKPFLNFSILGAVIGVIIITPHPQMAYFSLWALALYTLYKIIVDYVDNKSPVKSITLGGLVIYAVVIGVLLSAIQMFPGYYYTKKYSPRSEVKKGWEWATSWSLHEEEAASLIIPEFAGTSTSKAKTYYWGKNAFKDNSETVGIIPLFLALIAILFYRKKIIYFLAGLGLLSLVYALGATTPIFKIFYYLVPMVKSLRAPSMIMFIFVFCVALLAGMGVQHLFDLRGSKGRPRKSRLDYVLLGVPGLLFILAILFSFAGRGMLKLWTALFYSEAATTMVQKGVTKFDVAMMNLPAIQSGAWFAFLFVLLAALCIIMYNKGKAGVSVVLVLLMLPVLNSVRFNSRFISLFDYRPYTRTNAVVDHLAKDGKQFRVHDFTQNSKLNLPFHGVEVVTGYHGNQLKWYDQLIGGPSQRNLANPRLLNLVGAKYLIIPPNQKIPDNYLGAIPLKTALNFSTGTLIRNDNAFPRAYLTRTYKKYNDIDDIFAEIVTGKEDLSKTVLLEEDPGISLPDSTVGLDSAWIITYQIDSVVVGIESSDNSILVLTDNYYDSWHAYIDDKPATILRAYGSFRAVAIPAGTKRVTFRYESERYKTGKAVTWASILYLVIVFGAYSIKPLWMRNKKNKAV